MEENEIFGTQPQRRQAHEHAGKSGAERAGDKRRPERQPDLRREVRGRIAADCAEGGMGDRYLPGVADQKIE
jgi:hypothetical protein